VAGAAKHFQQYVSLLESQLVTLGLRPKRDISPTGNCFRLSGGFGCKATVYFKRAGNDVIVTPEVGRSTVGIILPVFLLCFFLCPGIILWFWVDRNIRKTLGKVLNAIESSEAEYKARFVRSAQVE